MKKPLLILLLVLAGTAIVAHAQSKGYGDNDTITFPKEGVQLKPQPKDRIHFGVSMGTSVAFSRGQDAAMGHFIAPTLSYQVSDKFRLRGGVGIQYNSLNNPWTYGNGESGGSIMVLRPKVQTFMYAQGEYDVNEKLTLTGRVFASTSAIQYPGLNPQTYNLHSFGGAAGFWYKPNGKTAIGAEVQIHRGNDPYQRYRPGGMVGGFDGPANRIGIWY